MTSRFLAWYDLSDFFRFDGNGVGRHGRSSACRRRQQQIVDLAGESMGLLVIHFVSTGAPGITYETACLQEFNSDQWRL